MHNWKYFFITFLARARSGFTRLATGGDWAIPQTDRTRRNLVWFWCDGFFASAADNIAASYLVIYLVHLGATQAQIGVMSALSSLSAAVLLLPGAMLVERMGKRRGLVLVGGGGARLAMLALSLLPLFASGDPLVLLAVLFSIARDALNNLSFPAWMSMTADMVPIEGRGRYFASRNFIMGLSGIAVTLLAGVMITRMVEPVGYQVALGAAFLFGSLSVFAFSRLKDSPKPLAYPRVQAPVSPRALLKDLVSSREFFLFASITALWNFSLNIAGPFFTVYLVQGLRADAAMVGLTSIASTAATMLAQRKVGEMNDRWGSRRLTIVSGLLIPLVPALWVFATAAWQVIPINLVSGALWGAYNLASFNYLLMITPEDRRARYSALFQITVTISLAVGAALGSLLVTGLGYQGVFLLSAGGRLVAAGLFAFLTARSARAASASTPV
jgi:MFS family permease